MTHACDGLTSGTAHRESARRCPVFAFALHPVLALALPLAFAALGTRAHAQGWDGPGSAYPVSELVIEYAYDHPGHIPIEEVMELEIGLYPTPNGYVAPKPTAWSDRLLLGQLPKGGRYYPSALQHINWWIVRSINLRGINAVIVTIPDIEPGTGRDLRPRGETALRVRIWTGRVAIVRTTADGARFDDLPPDRLDNLPTHRWIQESSPLQAGGGEELVRGKDLDDYTAQLSRHPGRQVAAELKPGSQPLTTRVSYRVIEAKPWTAYAETSNTGTDETTDWRQRFGFTHRQLTGRDDILRLDYVTGNFKGINGAYGSYEAPFRLGNPGLRWRVSGAWSEFDASDFGFSNETFDGSGWEAGGRVLYNIEQDSNLFVDLDVGVRWQHAEVNNDFLATSADDDFFVPHLGVVVERNSSLSSLNATASIEGNIASVAGSDKADMTLLGRQDPDKDFYLLRWNGSYVFYLEPIIAYYTERYRSTPSETSSVAHEMAVSFRGQWAMGNRLIPQYEEVVGGFYTVRGYEQSLIAGDTVVLGSAEYRYHLARALAPSPETIELPVLGAFQLRPPRPDARPDWDLILRGFLDLARVGYSNSFGYESDETLAGFGGGVELQLFENLSLRVDTAIALAQVESVDRGDTEIYFQGMILY